MTWLALHPWTIIVGMTLGLPLGMLLQRQHERRAAARHHREQLATRIEQAMRRERAQRNIDQALREAQLSAQAEADAEMRKAQVQSATTCGCANCRDFLQQQTAGRN